MTPRSPRGRRAQGLKKMRFTTFSRRLYENLDVFNRNYSSVGSGSVCTGASTAPVAHCFRDTAHRECGGICSSSTMARGLVRVTPKLFGSPHDHWYLASSGEASVCF